MTIVSKKIKELAKKNKIKLTYMRKGKRYKKTEKMLLRQINSKDRKAGNPIISSSSSSQTSSSQERKYHYPYNESKEENRNTSQKYYLNLLNKDEDNTEYIFEIKKEKEYSHYGIIKIESEDDENIHLNWVNFRDAIKGKKMCSNLVSEAIKTVLEKEKKKGVHITKGTVLVKSEENVKAAEMCYIHAFKNNGFFKSKRFEDTTTQFFKVVSLDFEKKLN